MTILQLLCSHRCPLAVNTHNWTHCSNCPTSQHGPHGKQRFYIVVFVGFRGSRCPETSAARATENIFLLLLRACTLLALPSSGRCLQSHRLATGLCATVYWKGSAESLYRWRTIYVTEWCHIRNTLGRRLTTDFRSDWKVVIRCGRVSAIYLLTVFFNLSNLFIIFIIYF
jgi:hypothetical protein